MCARSLCHVIPLKHFRQSGWKLEDTKQGCLTLSLVLLARQATPPVALQPLPDPPRHSSHSRSSAAPRQGLKGCRRHGFTGEFRGKLAKVIIPALRLTADFHLCVEYTIGVVY
jgi:hypothetical protein